MNSNNELLNLVLYKTKKKTYYYQLDHIKKIDIDIIPNILLNNNYKDSLEKGIKYYNLINLKKHNLKSLTKELSLVENTPLRNKIIEFAQVLKVAMSYRSDDKYGSPSIIKWECEYNKNNKNKKLNFIEKADLFYYLTNPYSYFNLILTAAVNINRNIKLELQYAQQGRQWCTKSAFYIKDVRRYLIDPPYGLDSNRQKENSCSKINMYNNKYYPYCKHFSGKLYYPECIRKKLPLMNYDPLKLNYTNNTKFKSFNCKSEININ